MHALRRALDSAGRNGPAQLFGAVPIGLVAAPLAEAARPPMGRFAGGFIGRNPRLRLRSSGIPRSSRTRR